MPDWTIRYSDGTHMHLNVIDMHDLCFYLENKIPRKEEVISIEQYDRKKVN